MGLAVVSFHPVLAKQSKDRSDIPPRALGRGAVWGLGGRWAGGCWACCPQGWGQAESVLTGHSAWGKENTLGTAAVLCQVPAGKIGKAHRGYPGKDHMVFGRLLGHVRLTCIEKAEV